MKPKNQKSRNARPMPNREKTIQPGRIARLDAWQSWLIEAYQLTVIWPLISKPSLHCLH